MGSSLMFSSPYMYFYHLQAVHNCRKDLGRFLSQGYEQCGRWDPVARDEGEKFLQKFPVDESVHVHIHMHIYMYTCVYAYTCVCVCV